MNRRSLDYEAFSFRFVMVGIALLTPGQSGEGVSRH
jgi:hypothetical protein